jgi:hypothetical protein
MAVEKGIQKASDELNATTEVSYKCANCGNMFSIQATGGVCDECGFRCDEDVCQIVNVSNEDY